jgi:hypothetical protein
MVTAPSRERTRRAAAAPRDETEHPFKGGRIAAPVLADDRTIGRAQDEAQGERRDDRIVQRAEDRDELRDEVYRRGEPEAGDRQDDLRAEWDTCVAEEAAEEADEIRQEKSELAREKDATDDHEHHDHDDPYRDEDKEYVRPDRKIHAG